MGLYIDDQPMTKKAALELLGVSPAFIPAVRRKIIQCNVKQIDRDKVRPMKSIGGKPAYLVYVPSLEREVMVRYAISPPRPHDTIVNKVVYNHPKTLGLHPAEDGTVLISDELEFLFWFLRPMCEQSPFRNKNQAYFYGFKDDNAKATADMQREEDYVLAISILVGPMSWTDTQLKQLAKGMNLAGVDDMTPMVVKHQLKQLAWKDPKGFYNRANSREVIFNGKIQEAIDMQILKLDTLHGLQRWYLNGEEILPISYGQDALNTLKDHMAEKWYLYEEKIREGLMGINIASKLASPLNDEAFIEEETAKERKKSELSEQEVKLLAEWRKKDFFEDKMKKIDAYDKSDLEALHASQKKSYLDNKEIFDIWKKDQIEQEQGVIA